MTPHRAPSACACSSGSDVAQAEPNIHAGVKYIRYMVDHFCGKEPMTSLDKMSFAFAAYNAGPRRIQSMRREAANRGLDPNVWFRNVEVVTAEKVGQETVTYVANIYKYYIAYQRVSRPTRRSARRERRHSDGSYDDQRFSASVGGERACRCAVVAVVTSASGASATHASRSV